MSIRFTCPTCAARIKLRDTARGRSYRCLRCATLFTVNAKPSNPVPNESPAVLPAPSRGRIVALIGAGLAVLIVVWAGLGLMADKRLHQTTDAPPTDAPATEVAVPMAEPPEVPCHFDIGDVRVLIAGASMDCTGYISILGRHEVTEETNLNIIVGVSNSNPARTIGFVGWSTERGGAKLTDELGNSYRQVTFGVGRIVVGSTESATLYADSMAQDVIVFERPVPAAKILTLQLSAENFGGKGSIKGRIPAVGLLDSDGLNKQVREYLAKLKRERGG